MASAELGDVAAIGGVGEYALGLAKELVARGHQVEVVLPLYGYLSRQARLQNVRERMMVPLGVGASEHAVVKRWPPSRLPFPVTLIGAHRHFTSARSASDVYEHWPNHEPWIAFARAIVEYLRICGTGPDIVHCLDAHTALVPVFLREAQRHRWDCPPARPATVLTIHNLLNQGKGDAGLLDWAGLAPGYWFGEWFEFHGAANCFKAGLLTADRVSTVSRTYAAEICGSPDFGFGLEGVLAQQRSRGRLEWVLNGITPARHSLPGVAYGAGADESSVRVVKELKQQQRRDLYAAWGWVDDGSPVVASRGRWDRQKGVVELVECIKRNIDRARFLVVTWGRHHATPELERAWRNLERLQATRPDRVLVNPPNLQGMENGACHYAVADFVLIPSWYEPCGLTQMECQRYGAIPIVRHTGGLADTVSESVTTEFPSPNGFVFSEPLGEHMVQRMSEALDRAISTIGHPAGDEMFRHTLEQDSSWSSRIEDYEALYRNAADTRLDEVIGCLSQRIAIKRSQGDRQGEAGALRDLGSAYAGGERTAAAREHWQHARELFDELGSAEADEIQRLLEPGHPA